MLRAHLDRVAAALAGHDAKPHHADEIWPRMLADMLDGPRRPRNVTAIRYLEVPDLLERIKLGQIERDCPIPDGAANREHLVGHHWCFLHRAAQRLDGDRLKAANGERAPAVTILEAAHMYFVIRLRAFREALELVAVAVTRNKIADRTCRVRRRCRGLAALNLSPEQSRLRLRVGQLDPLGLPLGAAARVPVILGIGLSARFRFDGLLDALRQLHALFPSWQGLLLP